MAYYEARPSTACWPAAPSGRQASASPSRRAGDCRRARGVDRALRPSSRGTLLLSRGRHGEDPRLRHRPGSSATRRPTNGTSWPPAYMAPEQLRREPVTSDRHLGPGGRAVRSGDRRHSLPPWSVAAVVEAILTPSLRLRRRSARACRPGSTASSSGRSPRTPGSVRRHIDLMIRSCLGVHPPSTTGAITISVCRRGCRSLDRGPAFRGHDPPRTRSSCATGLRKRSFAPQSDSRPLRGLPNLAFQFSGRPPTSGRSGAR